MKIIDSFLNRITMYRLVVYALAIYAVAGFLLASTGRIFMDAGDMAQSLLLLLVSCYVTDFALARIWKAPYNKESWLITSLILFLIIRPPANLSEIVITVVAGVVASASKYIIAWRGRHIFNPAAFAAAFLSLSSLQTTTWWIGNSTIWPLTLIIGLAIVRKIRRFELLSTFVLVSIFLEILQFLSASQPIGLGIKNVLIASPLIFLSTIMLTEPATMPPRKNMQIIFGLLVAILYVEGWKVGPIYIYPEVALLLGNVFAFLVSPKYRARLYLKEIQKISDQVYNFVFQPDKKIVFAPGQYMEWTLADVPFDGRGNRRTFTIASSPTEDNLQLGVKFYNPSSAYKHTMGRMKPGDTIYASQLAGNFTLQGNEKKKLAFIAGGIGVTPFRSMVKYITDTGMHCDVVVIYNVSKPEELAYKSEFLAAQSQGVRFVPVLNNTQTKVPNLVSADLNEHLIEKFVPDYKQRIFYVSGPDGMVRYTKRFLKNMGVAGANIKSDYFSGY